MSATPRTVLPVIAEGTAAIESAFLSAGQGLSSGLAAFRSLTDGLAALGAEFDGGSTASAALSLGRMSRRLRRIAERLPAEGLELGELLDGNRGLRRKFDDLVGDMRMMVIVSRSARLEAVVSDEQRVSLEAFSRTIDDQIGDVQRRIDRFAADHGQLTALLERDARAHLAFDERFRDRLVALAAALDEALAEIGERRDAGLAFTGDAAAKARGIAQSAGLALVSLQVGDNTRQRLEHVTHALERADALLAGGGGDAATAATADLLCRLQAAQLRDSVATFAGEASCILDTFALLGREAGGLAAAGRTTYGHADAGAGSFMAAFRARFADAMDIVAACEANRTAVEHAIGELRHMLEALGATLTTLDAASEGLVIVAMNVGLKAARLGSRGRGLVTVAGELKRLASEISLHAVSLLSTFQTVHRHADHFGPGMGDPPETAPSLAAEATAVLDALALGDARIAEVLAAVDRTARDFDATVGSAARAFEEAVAETGRLTAVADHIGRRTGPADANDAARASAVQAVDALLLPLYSMAQERDIHAAVVGSAAAASVAAWAA